MPDSLSPIPPNNQLAQGGTLTSSPQGSYVMTFTADGTQLTLTQTQSNTVETICAWQATATSVRFSETGLSATNAQGLVKVIASLFPPLQSLKVTDNGQVIITSVGGSQVWVWTFQPQAGSPQALAMDVASVKASVEHLHTKIDALGGSGHGTQPNQFPDPTTGTHARTPQKKAAT